MSPQELLYAETHEWAAISQEGGQKFATIGISNFAVEALSDLVFIQLPDVGRALAAGETFGEIESVKAVSDLYAPVDGEVIAVNTKLPDNLDVLHEDPFGKGWMIKLKISDDAGLAKLMDKAAYDKQCAEAAH